MSGFLCTRLHLLFNNTNTLLLSRTQLGKYHFHSFTVSYLRNSYGLSLETAKSVSNRVQFETPEKPDLVLKIFQKYGFTRTHISKIVRYYPSLLLANVEKTIVPKLEFFHSVGVSSDDIVSIISSNPTLLSRSLEKNIIPCYNYLKSLLLIDEKVVKAFRRSLWFSNKDPQKSLAPNIALLREIGVPPSSLSYLLAHPCAVSRKPSQFNKIVKEVKQVGFDPLKSVFVIAIAVLAQMSKLTLESKFEIYGRWGWSRDETLSAFKKQPMCMSISNKKITRVMDFFVNKMGRPSQIIGKHPNVLLLSFEKRIVPRCSVAHILLLNGLIEKDFSINTLLVTNEKFFLKKYVTNYQERVPQLLDLYKGKVNPLDLGITPIGNT